MSINKNELTKELVEKALQCRSVDELMALVKTAGFELTKEEAESYMMELADFELDENQLQQVAGGSGKCYKDCKHIDCGSVYVPN